MINMIFWALMSVIANIIQFIIVFGIVLYGFLGLSFITFLIDKHNSARKNFENKLKERK